MVVRVAGAEGGSPWRGSARPRRLRPEPVGHGGAGWGEGPLPVWLTGGRFRRPQAQAVQPCSWRLNTRESAPCGA